MVSNPSIFSTEGGLNVSIVRSWAYQNDIENVSLWLASGHKHPRLATEAIHYAVGQGYLEFAEKVWQAQWHKTATALERSWGGLRSKHPDCRHLAPGDQPAIEWLIAKSTPLPGKKPSGVQNAGLIAGLEYAFYSDNQPLWNRLLATGAHCKAGVGQDLLFKLTQRGSWWQGKEASKSHSPAWDDQALSEMLDHGLHMGGDAWVGSMLRPSAEGLFQALLVRAEKLTNPRQRSAIIALSQAYDLIKDRKESLEKRFFELGVASTIALTSTERRQAKGEWDRRDMVLENPSRPHSFLNSPQKNTLSLGEGHMELTNAFPLKERESIRGRIIGARLAPPTPSNPKPRF